MVFNFNDFNPRSPRRERLITITTSAWEWTISIHAPREGSDSVPSMRSALPGYFNPRSPRRERPYSDFGFVCSHIISIHAPREGSDAPEEELPDEEDVFQSTLPAKGATIENIER